MLIFSAIFQVFFRAFFTCFLGVFFHRPDFLSFSGAYGKIEIREGELRNYKEKQQRTVQAPGGFTDTSWLEILPDTGGLEGELRNYK